MSTVIRTGTVRLEWNGHITFENPDLPFSRIEPVLAVAEQDNAAPVLFERLFERQGTCFHLADDGLQFRHGGFKGLWGGCQLGHDAECGKPWVVRKKAAKKKLLSTYEKITERASSGQTSLTQGERSFFRLLFFFSLI